MSNFGKWDVMGDLAHLVLPTGEMLTIDAVDVALVSSYSWHRRTGTHPYARAWVNGTATYLHRMLLGSPEGQVDHRDRDWTNNRRNNLRHASSVGNAANSGPRRGSSRFKGVHRRADGKWIAQIAVAGRSTHLGVFKEEDMAAAAYDHAAQRQWGEFAWTNSQQ